MGKFRWGIIGPGNIAGKFAEGLAAVEDAELYAVASRSEERAAQFGEKFAVPARYGSYDQLLADKLVDAVYIATPHQTHKDCAIQCLEAGKPTLCEKPFAVNAGEARAMIDCARANGVFLMEAMWTRFSPISAEVRREVAEGAIGEVRMLQCHFGFCGGWNPEGRLLNPAYAGGGLLDVGVYCVSYARMVFGEAPSEMAGLADIGSTGVDEQAAWTFKYPSGKLALMSAAIRTNTPHEAVIMGTDGMIRVPDFWRGTKYLVNGDERQLELVGNGYNYEAAEVRNCVRAGKLESAILPLDESLEIVATMDSLRAGWGLKYPMEDN